MPSRLSRLPPWISHWLGYRSAAPKPLPTYQVAGWSFLTAFCGLSVVQGLFNYSDYFIERHVPGIIASYVSPITPPIPMPQLTQTTNRERQQFSVSAQSKAHSHNRAR